MSGPTPSTVKRLVSPDEVRDRLFNAISAVASDKAVLSTRPNIDFTRRRKLPADTLIRLLVAEGSGSTRNEIVDYFGVGDSIPSMSALTQQRAKLKPQAMAAVFRRFNGLCGDLRDKPRFRYVCADGTDIAFANDASPDLAAYHVDEGHSKRGYNSMHVNALYDVDRKTYLDAEIQPVHSKDEYRAFCDMVDRYDASDSGKAIFIGDRGYCSYNTMAHVIEKGQFFMFRTKDICSKGMTRGLGLPNQDNFDIPVNMSIARRHSKNKSSDGVFTRYVGKNVSFDYVPCGSRDSYAMAFRVVRFPLSKTECECIVTNLPIDMFPAEMIKKIYSWRWGIETSFRKLKYTIGLSNFHARKPEYVKQEIWARLIAYNFTETIISLAIVKEKSTKYEYHVDFGAAAHICRLFIQGKASCSGEAIIETLLRLTQPIRPDRKSARLKTAHFRKPRYFTYRAS